MMTEKCDVLILGAGAAGMMCAIRAGQRGRSVVILDHAKAPGEKIRISGGGRCNFTNIHPGPRNYLSANPHFAKSALARYTPRDFIALVEKHRISWHEKTLGQLFCDDSAKDIIRMLLAEMQAVNAKLRLETSVSAVTHDGGRFRVSTSGGVIEAAPALLLPIAHTTSSLRRRLHRWGRVLRPKFSRVQAFNSRRRRNSRVPARSALR